MGAIKQLQLECKEKKRKEKKRKEKKRKEKKAQLLFLGFRLVEWRWRGGAACSGSHLAGHVVCLKHLVLEVVGVQGLHVKARADVRDALCIEHLLVCCRLVRANEEARQDHLDLAHAVESFDVATSSGMEIHE